MLSHCAERYGASFSLFWRAESFSKEPQWVLLKSYMIILLQLLIAPLQIIPLGKNQSKQSSYVKREKIALNGLVEPSIARGQFSLAYRDYIPFIIIV